MRKLLPLFLVLSLVAGVPGAWAKSSSFGKSFGSSGFKSIQQMNVKPAPSAPSLGSNTMSLSTPRTSSVTVYHAWSPPVFFWVPMGSYGPMPAGAGMGWILILVIGAVVILVLVMRRRAVPADGDPEDEEEEQLEVLYERCRKNLEALTTSYLDAQRWLERLDGKVPAAQWRDWNDKYGRIQLDDFQKQLDEIRRDLDQGRLVAARTKLFSFDEDAVEVFEYLREVENAVEDLG
jgi:hypothetical protein